MSAPFGTQRRQASRVPSRTVTQIFSVISTGRFSGSGQAASAVQGSRLPSVTAEAAWSSARRIG
ncbi:hypothetical protein ACFSTI_21610 [Rhizorhabdus histidinilytica]